MLIIDFPQKLLKKDGETTFADVIKSAPLVGIYFSAHWCPPCRQFTPQLISFYNNVNKTQKEIEIVFVSSDQEEGEFKGYFAEMPWTAVPYDFEGREDLSENFEESSKNYSEMHTRKASVFRNTKLVFGMSD